MKAFPCTLLTLFFSLSIAAQNVGINKTMPLGKLHIKGNNDTTALILETPGTQPDGQPFLKFIIGSTEALRLHTDDPSNLFLGREAGKQNEPLPSPFLQGMNNTFLGSWSGSQNTRGTDNTATGVYSLTNNTTAFNNSAFGTAALEKNRNGNDNVALGRYALQDNWSGGRNTAVGTHAMWRVGPSANASNTNTYNTAVGFSALSGSFFFGSLNNGTHNTATGAFSISANNTGSYNTASGYYALTNNSTGNYNTAVGVQALHNNTSGFYNTALGINALYVNTTTGYNAALGYEALFRTTASENNTAVGSRAGDGHNHGYNNTFVGANTDANAPGLFNIVAVGQGTIVSASSTARFGNSATTSYGGWAGWSNISDGRFKTGVRENVPGLSFVTKLRPVT